MPEQTTRSSRARHGGPVRAHDADCPCRVRERVCSPEIGGTRDMRVIGLRGHRTGCEAGAGHDKGGAGRRRGEGRGKQEKGGKEERARTRMVGGTSTILFGECFKLIFLF